MFILCSENFSNVIDFVSIDSAGNATDFGDVGLQKRSGTGGIIVQQ